MSLVDTHRKSLIYFVNIWKKRITNANLQVTSSILRKMMPAKVRVLI